MDERHEGGEASTRDEESVWTARRFAPTLHLGIATPYGAIGAALDVSVVEAFALEGGVGFGSGGPQVALMPRLRLATARRVAFSLGSGASAGPYTADSEVGGLMAVMSAMDHSPPDRKVWDVAFWHDTEFSIERRAPREGIAVRAYVGYGYIVNDTDYVCEETSGYGCEGGNNLLYGGVALGLPL